jgi:hypothetical protein
MRINRHAIFGPRRPESTSLAGCVHARKTRGRGALSPGSQLDRLYQRVIEDLDKAMDAAGLKAARRKRIAADSKYSFEYNVDVPFSRGWIGSMVITSDFPGVIGI